MCTVQNTTNEMNDVLSWKDRLVAPASTPPTMRHPPQRATSSSARVERNSARTGQKRCGNTERRRASSCSDEQQRAVVETGTTVTPRVQQQPLLHSKWALYYHNPNTNDWSNESYRRIARLNSIHAFCAYYKQMDFEECAHGMFFLMRDNIMPTWEDEHNKGGGCWSFKVSLNHFFYVWKHLSMLLVGESLSTVPMLLNGISVSPKRGFCIVKLWNHDSKHNKTDILKLTEVKYLEDNGPALYTPFNHKK